MSHTLIKPSPAWPHLQMISRFHCQSAFASIPHTVISAQPRFRPPSCQPWKRPIRTSIWQSPEACAPPTSLVPNHPARTASSSSPERFPSYQNVINSSGLTVFVSTEWLWLVLLRLRTDSSQQAPSSPCKTSPCMFGILCMALQDSFILPFLKLCGVHNFMIILL